MVQMAHLRTLISLGLSVSLLGGCAVAREEVRITFDDRILRPGESRVEVERAFGKPDLVTDKDRHTTVQYSTSKVDNRAKHNLAFSRADGDLFTLGVFEITDPFAVSDDEGKIFTITYQDEGILGPVLVVCPSQGKERV